MAAPGAPGRDQARRPPCAGGRSNPPSTLSRSRSSRPFLFRHSWQCRRNYKACRGKRRLRFARCFVIRSLLYVPASSERFVAKAAERGADAIILDLEDAVAPSEKAAARNKLNETVPAVGGMAPPCSFGWTNSERAPGRLRSDAEAAVKAGASACWCRNRGTRRRCSNLPHGSSRWRTAASPARWYR